MSETQYFYADGNEQRGPHSAAEIAQMRLPGQTLVWREGMPEWQRLDSVAELAPPRPVTPPHPGLPHVGPQGFTAQPMGSQGRYGTPVYPLPPRDSSKKLCAGIFGLLLGTFGVHKFVLGYTNAGLIMCLVTILTCGAGAAVFGIIGFIEGIIYLSKSDEEFYQTYVVNRREWF